MSLVEKVKHIETREDFVSFVYDLIRDLEENPGQWENPRVDLFLNALARTVTTLDGRRFGNEQAIAEEPSWNLFGHILLWSSTYE